MKYYIQRLICIALISGLVGTKAYTQVRIGAASPTPVNPAASLEISSGPYADNSFRGLLLPKVALIDYSTWTLAGDPVEGMIVYNTATSTGNHVVTPGVYCWFNFQWNRLISTLTPAILSMLDCQTNNSAGGAYLNGVALTSSNVKLVTVTPKSAGNYSITTNTVNGYSFSASGSFTTAQVGNSQVINLLGAGTPQNVGVDSFTATADGQSCPFSVTVSRYVDCSGPLTGTYKINKSLDSTNTKQITIVPRMAGNYHIVAIIDTPLPDTGTLSFFNNKVVITDAQVGIPQTIILAGSGISQRTGTFTGSLLVAVNSSSYIVGCSFSVTVVP